MTLISLNLKKLSAKKHTNVSDSPSIASVRTSRWSLARPSARECVPAGASSAGTVGLCGAHPKASALPTAVTIAAAPRSC